MTKESLMAMGLTEEQADKVMGELGSSFVPKTRFDEISTELQTAKTTIKERDTQLEALQKSAGDNQALKDQITQLQTDNANQKKEHEAEMKKIRVGNAVDRALSDAKAINPTAVKPFLADFLEKAELDKDGNISGLVDEIGKLTKGEGTSFLFKVDPAAPAVSGTSPAGSVTTPPDAKTMAYETRLSDARKAGNSALAVAIKREAAADGVQLF